MMNLDLQLFTENASESGLGENGFGMDLGASFSALV